jgi:hypothetical protein
LNECKEDEKEIGRLAEDYEASIRISKTSLARIERYEEDTGGGASAIAHMNTSKLPPGWMHQSRDRRLYGGIV